MPHLQTPSERRAELALRAVGILRSGLYLKLRYLDGALAALPPRTKQGLYGFATDGAALYYTPAWLLRVFRDNERFTERAYLHTVLHCLFRHLWLRGNRKPRLWGLACDIAVESVIDTLPGFERPLTLMRTETYAAVREQSGYLAAGPAYRWLAGQTLYAPEELAREFHIDDHTLWPLRADEPQAAAQAARWEQAGRGAQIQLERIGQEQGEGRGPLSVQMEAAKSRRSYRRFLRQFAALCEEPECDPDSFDLNYYTYGLSLYGNMPLIEPLESSERMRIGEFVLVLDTSLSTSGALIKEFLRQTFAILGSGDSFSRRCSLRILQCDDAVRADTVLRSRDDLDALLKDFTVLGGGGTDFRPAFAYVDRLIEQKAIRRLRGLLYLTDGKGVYPARRPAYDTAFLFLDHYYDDSALPPWAIRLVLEPEEFVPAARGRADIADDSVLPQEEKP